MYELGSIATVILASGWVSHSAARAVARRPMRRAELDEDVTAFLAEQARRTAAEFGVEAPGASCRSSSGASARSPDGRRAPTAIRQPTRARLVAAVPLRDRARGLPLVVLAAADVHWSHEALAVQAAVRAMEEIGQDASVERLAASPTEEDELLTVVLGPPAADWV